MSSSPRMMQPNLRLSQTGLDQIVSEKLENVNSKAHSAAYRSASPSKALPSTEHFVSVPNRIRPETENQPALNINKSLETIIQEIQYTDNNTLTDAYLHTQISTGPGCLKKSHDFLQ